MMSNRLMSPPLRASFRRDPLDLTAEVRPTLPKCQRPAHASLSVTYVGLASLLTGAQPGNATFVGSALLP